MIKIPAIIYSRVVGYFSPQSIGGVNKWNKGKASEFQDRKTYKIGELKNEEN